MEFFYVAAKVSSFFYVGIVDKYMMYDFEMYDK